MIMIIIMSWKYKIILFKQKSNLIYSKRFYFISDLCDKYCFIVSKKKLVENVFGVIKNKTVIVVIKETNLNYSFDD